MTDEAPHVGPVLGTLRVGILGLADARVLLVDAPSLGRTIQERHGLQAEAARLAAEAAVAALLMTAQIKGQERVTLQIRSDEPRFAFIADADAQGGVRARATPATVPTATGLTGILSAIKSDARRELYRGVTALEDQTISEALDAYMRQSAQVGATLRIEVDLDAIGLVVASRGLLVEPLPAAVRQPRDFFTQAYPELATLPLATAVRSDAIGDHALAILEERDIRWRCGCGQARIESVLVRLGRAELESLLAEQGGAEVTCDFCNAAYQVDAARLREIIDAAGDGAG